MARAGSCMATLSPCQHVGEIKAAAAGHADCQLVSGHSPPRTYVSRSLFIEKEFTIQTLAAMALAVYTTIERRSKACAMEVKS